MDWEDTSGVTSLRDPLVGTTVGDTYRVLRRIAEGGMATIYEAEHLRIQKIVALKVLRGSAANEPSNVARFRLEARAASVIGHPNVIEISDFGLCDDGAPYLVMERLVGEGLDALLRREGALAIDRAVRIARQIASALAAAHASGVVHRDLKPANVFVLTRDGSPDFVKLLDFGVSRFVGGLQEDPRITCDGFALGTPRYMAPEQAEGSRDVDARADVHALGAILYRALTGIDAFPGLSIVETIFSVLCRTPPSVLDARPEVSVGLAAVVARSLEKKPDARFQTAEDFALALDANAPSETVRARALLKSTRPTSLEPPVPARAPTRPKKLLGARTTIRTKRFEARDYDERSLSAVEGGEECVGVGIGERPRLRQPRGPKPTTR